MHCLEPQAQEWQTLLPAVARQPSSQHTGSAASGQGQQAAQKSAPRPSSQMPQLTLLAAAPKLLQWYAVCRLYIKPAS